MDVHRAGAVVQASPQDEVGHRLALPACDRIRVCVRIQPPECTLHYVTTSSFKGPCLTDTLLFQSFQMGLAHALHST